MLGEALAGIETLQLLRNLASGEYSRSNPVIFAGTLSQAFKIPNAVTMKLSEWNQAFGPLHFSENEVDELITPYIETYISSVTVDKSV
ncbi:hypothetical protein [Deinococcus sp. QL22]|uniref:hypothetical protein n=1 Tax=Deinococcus sp. QL22 TaxID=2939437 RepID=UPI002017CA11|nr:hypothetical protein [Deinococcus sp. QL22]UQN08212.1 hypothetical protein M1R55_19235 [Deinococcus sp. QL22]